MFVTLQIVDLWDCVVDKCVAVADLWDFCVGYKYCGWCNGGHLGFLCGLP